jgi:hypothetical protein
VNLLRDIITYVRRIIKSPSDAVITDNLIIDYINRFWIMDVDARIQLFDLKTKYQFQTVPGVDQYNMPLYSVQTETIGSTTSQDIGIFPVYQGFLPGCFVNGIQVGFQTDRSMFFNIWPNVVQQMYFIGSGDGVTTNFSFTFPVTPNNIIPPSVPYQYFLRGHTDITGIISTGSNADPIFGTTLNNTAGVMNVPSTSIFPAVYITSVDANQNSLVVQDSGQFLKISGVNMPNYGLLMNPGLPPYGYTALSGGYSTTLNTINYLTGQGNVTFTTPPAAGAAISAQAYLFQSGLPRGVLYWNNTIILRSPPDRQYLVELDAYLSPAAFFNTSSAIPFGYMAEYLSRGAARKILSDTGDVEQFKFYEPLFREQEILVWKRSQRQFTSTRTQTIYSQGINQGQWGYNSIGGSSL